MVEGDEWMRIGWLMELVSILFIFWSEFVHEGAIWNNRGWQECFFFQIVVRMGIAALLIIQKLFCLLWLDTKWWAIQLQGEDISVAAVREVKEETGVSNPFPSIYIIYTLWFMLPISMVWWILLVCTASDWCRVFRGISIQVQVFILNVLF